MIERYVHLTERQAAALFIAIVFIGKIYAVLAYGPDFALFMTDYNRVFCPPHCWTFQTSIPYSVVWTWMNPLWLGRFWYGVYVVIFDALTVIGFWQIKRISKFYLAMLQGMSIMFYLGQGAEYQNITIIAFLPLMFFALRDKTYSRKWLAVLAAIPILIKLPLGWAVPWDLMNPHVVCVWACSGIVQQTQIPIYDRLGALITNYGILVFSWYFTITSVIPRKNKKVK